MNSDHRDAIRKSNQTRNLRCGQCGSMGLKIVDGAKVGGMAGLNYKVCDGCGWTRALPDAPGKRGCAMSDTSKDTIPLDRAKLCLDCERIGANSLVCPHCQSRALLNLQRVLDREESKIAA